MVWKDRTLMSDDTWRKLIICFMKTLSRATSLEADTTFLATNAQSNPRTRIHFTIIIVTVSP